MSVFFITGVDTRIGKTYATGYLAKQLLENGINVITQKLIETGCDGKIAEDIITHRQLMQIPLQPVDHEQVSCPFVFKASAPPYIASSLEAIPLYPTRITIATQQLKLKYEMVLLETSGGIMTPITESLLTIDYIAAQRHPVVLVTSATLESINHTLLALQAIAQRGLTLHAVIYNQYQDRSAEADIEELAADEVLHDEQLYGQTFTEHRVKTNLLQNTRLYLQEYLEQHHPKTFWVELPHISFSGKSVSYQKVKEEDKDSNSNKNSIPSYSIEKYAQEIADNTLYAESLYRKIAKK